MKKPGIEQFFEKERTKLTTVGAFLGVGISAVAATSSLIAIPFFIFTLPFAADVMEMNKMLSEDRKYKPKSKAMPMYFNPNFKEKVKNWLDDYINNSENITEEKYKALFLILWMNQKKIKIQHLTPRGHGIFEKLSNKLFNAGETTSHLMDMYDNVSSWDDLLRKQQMSVLSFFEEDRHDAKKWEIAKKVYKEYEDIGLAAKLFLSKNDNEVGLFLQDYKFNQTDYEIIENYTKYMKEEKYIGEFKIYSFIEKDYINKLIDGEDNVKNLIILHNYANELYNIESKDKNKNLSPLKDMSKKIKTKIDYLELGESLQEKPQADKPKNSKRMKV